MPQHHHLARLPGCLLLRRSLSLCAALLAACGGGSASSDTPPLDASVAFAATDLDFPNPERGMTRSLGPLASVSDNQLTALPADGVRLAYAPLRLDPWRDASLPDNLLLAGLQHPKCRGVYSFLTRPIEPQKFFPLGLILGHRHPGNHELPPLRERCFCQ